MNSFTPEKLKQEQLDWKKVDGLMPVIVQDIRNAEVLMLGYMNQEALEATIKTGFITFYSRTKERLWMKGETSGNKLLLNKLTQDCDNDSLLALVTPMGPVCHTGTRTCFPAIESSDWTFITELEHLLKTRDETRPEGSYTASLFNAGISKIAQKVGEEAVETVIASLENDQTAFCGEAADLVFHLLVLLRSKKVVIRDIIAVLKTRKI